MAAGGRQQLEEDGREERESKRVDVRKELVKIFAD